MSAERPISGISRRGFIRRAATLSAGAAIIALRQGVTLNPGHVNYDSLSSEDSEALSSFKPITIAHRAGNNAQGIRNAKDAGITFADLDITKIGNELYPYHGKGKSVGKIVLGRLDIGKWNFGIGTPTFSLDECYAVAQEQERGLFAELKHGDFEHKDVEKIFGLSEKYHVLTLVHGNFKRIDMAMDVIEDPNKCIYVPEKHEWVKFFGEQDARRRTAVLTNPFSIGWQKQLIIDYGITVYAGHADTPDTVRQLWNNGVNRFFNERKVLQSLFRESKSATEIEG